MTKVISFSALILLLTISGCLLLIQKRATMVIINDQIKVEVEVADSREEQSTGLSYRESLLPEQGMLFVYSNYSIRSFWMKNMNFSIDIIWIKDNQIVGFHENLLPEGDSPKQRYLSPEKVNYVLEVTAGFVANHSIKVGDKVEFKN